MESLIIESLAPPQHMAKKHKCLDDSFAEEQYGKFLTAARVSSEMGAVFGHKPQTEMACVSDELSECVPLIDDVHFHCWGCDPELVFHGHFHRSLWCSR